MQKSYLLVELWVFVCVFVLFWNIIDDENAHLFLVSILVIQLSSVTTTIIFVLIPENIDKNFSLPWSACQSFTGKFQYATVLKVDKTR